MRKFLNQQWRGQMWANEEYLLTLAHAKLIEGSVEQVFDLVWRVDSTEEISPKIYRRR